MGLFSNLFGGGDDSGENAAQLIAQQNLLSQQGIESQFGQTQANLQPFITAGQEGLADVQQGATIPGFSERLNEIFGTDIFNRLRGERRQDIGFQLAATGQRRSGTGLETIANIPNELALALENLLTQRSGALSSQGLGAAGTLGQFGAQKEGAITALRSGTGEAQAGGFLQDQRSKTSGFQNLLGLGSSVIGGGLGGLPEGALSGIFGGGSIGGFASGALQGLFFSDLNLKCNVFVIGEIMMRDGIVLKVYKWKWIPETEGTVIEMFKELDVGFMAQDVKKVYPQHVYNVGDYLVIDYEGLHAEMAVTNG